MFFSEDFLLKKQGGMGIIWLTATLGIKHKRGPSRKQMLTLDISKACDGIREPVEPIALRTSAGLLVGVARVHGFKYEVFVEEVTNLDLALRRAMLTGRKLGSGPGGTGIGGLDAPSGGNARTEAITHAILPNDLGPNFDFAAMDWAEFQRKRAARLAGDADGTTDEEDVNMQSEKSSSRSSTPQGFAPRKTLKSKDINLPTHRQRANSLGQNFVETLADLPDFPKTRTVGITGGGSGSGRENRQGDNDLGEIGLLARAGSQSTQLLRGSAGNRSRGSGDFAGGARGGFSSSIGGAMQGVEIERFDLEIDIGLDEMGGADGQLLGDEPQQGQYDQQEQDFDMIGNMQDAMQADNQDDVMQVDVAENMMGESNNANVILPFADAPAIDASETASEIVQMPKKLRKTKISRDLVLEIDDPGNTDARMISYIAHMKNLRNQQTTVAAQKAARDQIASAMDTGLPFGFSGAADEILDLFKTVNRKKHHGKAPPIDEAVDEALIQEEPGQSRRREQPEMDVHDDNNQMEMGGYNDQAFDADDPERGRRGSADLPDVEIGRRGSQVPPSLHSHARSIAPWKAGGTMPPSSDFGGDGGMALPGGSSFTHDVRLSILNTPQNNRVQMRGRASSAAASQHPGSAQRAGGIAPGGGTPLGLNDQGFALPEEAYPRGTYQDPDTIAPQVASLDQTSSQIWSWLKQQLRPDVFGTELDLSFDELLPVARTDRTVAASAFYQLLSLTTKDLLKLDQSESYGDISVAFKHQPIFVPEAEADAEAMALE